jgi:hypothetical protein
MIDIGSELKAKWEEARRTDRAGHEWRGVALGIKAPARFLAGIREPDDKLSLLLEAPLTSAPPAIFRLEAEGLTVVDQRRPEEGIYRLAITLELEEVRDVFEVLAADVIDVVCQSTTVPDAISAITRRLLAWRACLKSRRRGLSIEEQCGLMGELTILQSLGHTIGFSDALVAWEGPVDGLHDFTLSGVAIEVKCLLGVGSLLHITRLDQLESRGLSTLVIARPKFRQDITGMTLSEKITEIRSELAFSAPQMISTFNEKLLRVGYLDFDARQYDDLRMMLYELTGFRVGDEFPRLTTSTVPAGIVDGSYTIDERSLSRFRMDSERLIGIMKSMNGGGGEQPRA